MCVFWFHKSTLCSVTQVLSSLNTSRECIFRLSNIPLRHPVEAAWNPGHTPHCPHRGSGLACPPSPTPPTSHRPGCGPVPTMGSLCCSDVPLGPIPGISGSQGGVFSRLWAHTDTDPRGWTNTLQAAMGVFGHSQGSPSFCVGRVWVSFSPCTHAPEFSQPTARKH